MSLAALHPPSEVGKLQYKSPEWRLAMVRLYRVILRLHNKTVAVSLETSREAQGGPQAAVSEVVQGRDPSHKDDYIVKYLLTPEQQEFGNKFVMDAFRHHMDADRKSSEQFYEGWYQYVAQIASGVTARDLTQEETMYLSDEQKEQLNQIRDTFLKAREGQEPNYMV
ncbi:hypothetical protein AGDE_03178 [Angomonas deanei]|nr:hypothetical protein AGDE_03178 [Angomonas deanei]|eukprot:EPY40749.1 hypothetical protein AGDE_03178 [Angomonas deanei]